MALISILVPVYRVEHCLDRCVQSILSQTFQDYELILVDDGSPDSCPALCDNYAASDPRIRVIHQANAGAGAARNAALDWVEANSASEYLCFVDSDDWAHPNMLEYLLRSAREHNAPMSICGYIETGEQQPWQEERYAVELWQPGDFYYQRFINATVPWGKLYRRDLFRGKRYPVGTYLDDEFLTYRLLFQAGTLPVVTAPLYAYYVNPDGLTKRGWTPKLMHVWDAYDQQIVFFTERGDEKLVHFRYRDYIDNAAKQMASARETLEGAELEKTLAAMSKRLRPMLRRAWKGGHTDFFFDFDLLMQVLPLRTKLFRKWVEWKAPK